MKHGMEKIAKKAVRAHEERMHKGVKKFSKGGLNMDRKRVGRNMAKVMCQRGR
jgi:hypothetical protein